MPLKIIDRQVPLTSLVGLGPTRARHIAPGSALQRLRYTQGRTITESAIELEQAWVEARLGVAGRRLSAGIVEGLQVSVPDQTTDPGVVVLGSGRGIAPGGQDIVVHRARTLRLDDIALIGSASEEAGPPRGLVALVVEPIVVETERLPQDGSALFAFEDPCPPDATAAPYLDFVLQDAARVGWAALDDGLMGSDPDFAVNVAAEAVRQMEIAEPDSLPWAAFGLPVVLMFVSPEGTVEWHHRAAVARRGGMLPQASLTALDRIRQSRVEGLIEETAMVSRHGWSGRTAYEFLRHLPPAGLLPRKTWDGGDFFPPSWGQAQAPIPRSQLDAALESARAMAPYDTSVGRDRVKWLVPVPDHLYAPDLLEPVTDPDFEEVLRILESRVAEALHLRNGYRDQGLNVQGSIDLSAVTDFSTVDDDPIEGESDFDVIEEPPEGQGGEPPPVVVIDPPDPVPFGIEATDQLAEVHSGLSATLFTQPQRDMVDPGRLDAALVASGESFGVTPFIEDMRALVDNANDTVDFAFNRVQAEIYRLRQITLDNEEATKLATFPVLAGLAKGTNNYALSEGLRSHFLAKTEVAVSQATLAPTGDGGGGESVTDVTPIPSLGFLPFLHFVPSLTVESSNEIVENASSESGSLQEEQIVQTEAFGATISPALVGFSENNATLSYGAALANANTLSGSNATILKTLVDETKAGLVDDVLLANAASKVTGILRAAPLPGDIRDVRSATIADRLKTSAALHAKASALRIKADVLREIQELDISIEGLRAPLTSGRDVVLLLKEDVDAAIAALPTGPDVKPVPTETLAGMRRPLEVADDDREWELVALAPAEASQEPAGVTLLSLLATILRRRTAPIDLNLLPALTLSKQLDPDPVADGSPGSEGDDESAYLSSAVTTLESVIAYLRAVEGRIGAISSAVDQVATQVKVFDDVQNRWEGALAMADQDLDEARHDLRVATSLIDEEGRRLDALREHRQKVIAEEVKFVAYVRPRALEAHRAGDTLGLQLPGAFDDPLPDALRQDADLPEELEEMIAALREMPLAWFASNPELAARFRSPRYLDRLYLAVKTRAQIRYAAMVNNPLGLAVRTRGTAPAFRAARHVVSGYQGLMLNILKSRAALDIVALNRASWADRRRRALADMSLNDIIESGTQPRVARRAIVEIERIERVLHAQMQLFRKVPSPVRLLWAQSLSVFDQVTSLRNLMRLPSWDRIDYDLAKKLQRLNNWLFRRMEKGVAEADALMTDLVRVSILLAAHAPVAEIVTARIDVNQTVQPGGAIDLVVRRGVPQIGMQVAVFNAGQVQARGVLRDLSGSRAKVEMVYLAPGLTKLTAGQEVAVYAPDARHLTAQ